MSGFTPGVTRRNSLNRASSPNITDEFDCSADSGLDGAVASSRTPGSVRNVSGPSGGKAKARRNTAIASRSCTAS